MNRTPWGSHSSGTKRHGTKSPAKLSPTTYYGALLGLDPSASVKQGF